MYDIILIDIDNTLLNFTAAEDKAIRTTFNKFNIQVTEELVKKFKAINTNLWKQFELNKITKEVLLEKRFTDLFLEIPGLKVDFTSKVVNKYYLNELSTCSDLMPNAYETLQRLSKITKIYPVTNGVYKTQMSRINNSTIKDFFSDIFISEVIGIQKPEIGFFDFVFSKLGSPDKKRVLLVGDSLSADIIGGIDYGLDTCWYNPNGLEPSITPTYIIYDLKELIDIIK